MSKITKIIGDYVEYGAQKKRNSHSHLNIIISRKFAATVERSMQKVDFFIPVDQRNLK